MNIVALPRRQAARPPSRDVRQVNRWSAYRASLIFSKQQCSVVGGCGHLRQDEHAPRVYEGRPCSLRRRQRLEDDAGSRHPGRGHLHQVRGEDPDVETHGVAFILEFSVRAATSAAASSDRPTTAS
jgi:hypothetical protein